jgi:hypothetical protein
MIIRYQDQLFENQGLLKKLQVEKEKLDVKYKQLQSDVEEDKVKSKTWRGRHAIFSC